MNEEAEALVGFRPASAEWLRNRWTEPSVDRASDIAVVEAPDREVCGFVGVAGDPPYVEVFVLGVVALGLHGRGIGSELVREGERRAARFASLAPPDARVVVHYGALADEPRVSGLLERHGYRDGARASSERTTSATRCSPRPGSTPRSGSSPGRAARSPATPARASRRTRTRHAGT